MAAAALVLYAAAFVCFVIKAGNGTAFGLDPLGLGAACVTLLWFLQVLIPAVT